jgi:flagellar protein FlhE
MKKSYLVPIRSIVRKRNACTVHLHPQLSSKECHMKHNKWLCSVFLALATTIAFAPSANAYTAGYSSEAVAPTISVKNFLYDVAFPVLGNPPSNAVITQASYRWDYSSTPAGLEVYICNNVGSICWDVTYSRSGSLNLNGITLLANQPLKLYARVVGSGTMMPLYGGVSAISVTYEW